MNVSIFLLVLGGITLAIAALLLEVWPRPNPKTPDVEQLVDKIMLLPEEDRMELRAITENMLTNAYENGPLGPADPY